MSIPVYEQSGLIDLTPKTEEFPQPISRIFGAVPKEFTKLCFPYLLNNFARENLIFILKKSIVKYIFNIDLFYYRVIGLKKYIKKNGDSRVPHRYIDEDSFKLGIWIGSRKTDYSKVNLP